MLFYGFTQDITSHKKRLHIILKHDLTKSKTDFGVTNLGVLMVMLL